MLFRSTLVDLGGPGVTPLTLNGFEASVSSFIRSDKSSTYILIEEVEKSIIGVSSTSPGLDRITVWLLKASWAHVRYFMHAIY